MSEKKNKNNNDSKNNGLFMFAPDDDDDIDTIIDTQKDDSFDFIMPLDMEDTRGLKLGDDDNTDILTDNNESFVAENSPNLTEKKISKSQKAKSKNVDTDEKAFVSQAKASEGKKTIKEDKPADKAKKEPKDKTKKTVETKKVEKPNKSPKPEKVKKPQSTASFIITISAKLILICSVVALLIAAVYSITAPIIKSNNEAKINKTVLEIFPDMKETQTIPCKDDDLINNIYLVFDDSGVLGYCADISVKGYKMMNLIIGVDNSQRITSIKVMSHSETPGYGTRVLDPEYLEKTSGYIGFNKESDEIDVYSGATYTSKGVKNAVNSALGAYDSYVIPYIEAEGVSASIEELPSQREEMLPPTPVELELEAINAAFSSITEEHWAQSANELNHPFDALYYVKVVDPERGEENGGYATVTDIVTESGSCKLIVNTWFGNIWSIVLLDTTGEEFVLLSENKERQNEIKKGVNTGVALDEPTEAESIVYEKVNEAFWFLPQFKSLTQIEQGGAVNE